jgi:hypothetical protein
MKKVLFIVIAAVAVTFGFNACGNGSKKVETSETTESVEVVEVVETVVDEVVETTDTIATKVEETVE